MRSKELFTATFVFLKVLISKQLLQALQTAGEAKSSSSKKKMDQKKKNKLLFCYAAAETGGTFLKVTVNKSQNNILLLCFSK